MKRLMIGQYGSFDDKKYARDYNQDFYGIEACMFQQEEDVDKLMTVSQRDNFKIGIHFPLRSWKVKLRDPQFLSADDTVRAEYFKLMEDEFEYLQRLKPQYILFHYPKPVILDDNVDWTIWRFGDKSEYVFESQYSYHELEEKSQYLFGWLTEKSEKYKFTPVLELDALNSYIYNSDFLEQLLNKYPKVRLCLDTGRLHLQDRIDPNFAAKDMIRRYAKYAEVVHLWNVKVNESMEYNHFPVLQSLRTEEGWAPIEDYLRIIQEENKYAKLLFEHRSDLISDQELKQCYMWVEGLLK